MSDAARKVVFVSDQTPEQPTDGLWSRLSLIEGQPLDARAAAYSALHEDLSRRLESVPGGVGSRAVAGSTVSQG